MDSCIACGQVTRVRINPSPNFGGTVRLHRHASTDSKTRPIDLNGQPSSTRQLVAQNSSWAVVDGHQNIDSAIVVDVAKRGAATHCQLPEGGASSISGVR